MNLVEKFGEKASALTIKQFCPPRCFEFAGKTLTFIMDSGDETGETVLEFLDETNVKWSYANGRRCGESVYEVRKADDWTYLLSFCAYEPRENFTFVVDREQELVTCLHNTLGENVYYPYLIESHYTFGYLKIEGKEHTDRRRHGFTDDVSGTGVRWVYGNNMSTVHVYYCRDWYRIAYNREGTSMDVLDDDPAESKEAANNRLRQAMRELPSSDEPAFYVKIKEGIYFVSITEQNMEKYYGARVGFRSDNLCFLDNWNRFYSVGRAYGTMTVAGQDNEMFFMIGKYAKPEDIDPHFFTDPNPYLA